MLLLLGFSASFAVSVGCKSIEAPALRTTTSRRAILAGSFLHSCAQPESNSGSNPISIDREPPCYCPSSRPPSPSPWTVSPSKNQRVEQQLPGVRSSLPAVYINVSSLSQTLESIRSELTEIFRPSYRRGIVSQPGAAEEERLSEYSKRQVHFGEPGGSCWIIDLRYPQEHRNTEMDGCYSYFLANCPHVVSFVERKRAKSSTPDLGLNLEYAYTRCNF